jgi:VIT1/CCC1 family predicted Fe2+/Mn2+ transporter
MASSTSSVSQRDYYRAERAREATEIDAMPEAERQEVRDIYATKGFSGDLLERVSTPSRPTGRVGWER